MGIRAYVASSAVACMLIAPAALVLIAPSALALEQAATAKDTISFGVVPQHSLNKLISAWTPLLVYLGENTGRTFRFDSAPDIEAFDQRVRKGGFDIAYMNPALYSVVHKSIGYQVIAKEKDTVLKGLIVIQKNGSVKSLRDLAGKTMAFPGPIAFAATVLPLSELSRLNIKITPVYAGSHDSVYNDVARGLYMAGGGVEKTLQQTDKIIRDELRVLWTSDAYPPHPFAIHPRLDSLLSKQLQKILIEMDQNPRGLAILKELRFKGFSTAADQDYDNLKFLAQPDPSAIFR